MGIFGNWEKTKCCWILLQPLSNSEPIVSFFIPNPVTESQLASAAVCGVVDPKMNLIWKVLYSNFLDRPTFPGVLYVVVINLTRRKDLSSSNEGVSFGQTAWWSHVHPLTISLWRVPSRSSPPAVHHPDSPRTQRPTEHDAGSLQCHQQDIELGPVNDGHSHGHCSHVQPEGEDREARSHTHRR